MRTHPSVDAGQRGSGAQPFAGQRGGEAGAGEEERAASPTPAAVTAEFLRLAARGCVLPRVEPSGPAQPCPARRDAPGPARPRRTRPICRPRDPPAQPSPVPCVAGSENRDPTMSLYSGIACRRKFSWSYRLLSTYVTKIRYLLALKEDDEACRKAQQTGAFYLFHNLAPLLQKSEHKYQVPRHSLAELKSLLGKFGQDAEKIEDSVLIGCSKQLEAWFALDLALNSSSSLNASLQKSEVETELQGSFVDLRKALFQLSAKDASLLSTAQALLRWHDAHQFCSRSGHPTKKNMAGSKRVCPSNSIIYYPQMAPVVITLVSDGPRCLLARQSSFPKGMYSALAGFCDMGESVEETVRREVAEEVGLEVERLQYTASQHWPFPNSSLMIGCHATVKPGQTEIQMNSGELEAAAWFSHDEVAAALRSNRTAQKQTGGLPFWLPPKLAIAHHLIKEWVENTACVPA